MLLVNGNTPQDRLWQAAAAVAHAVGDHVDLVLAALGARPDGEDAAERIAHAVETWHTVALEIYRELRGVPVARRAAA